MKKAWIDNTNTVIDAVSGDPAKLFHPDVAKHYTADVPDDIVPGAHLVQGTWTNPPAIAGAGNQVEPAPAPPTVGPNEFYFLWSMQEQIAIEDLRQADPVVKLFMRRLDDPRTTEVVLADPAVQAAIKHTVEQLAAAGVVPEDQVDARTAAIVTGARG
jgi:hypothetical protein